MSKSAIMDIIEKLKHRDIKNIEILYGQDMYIIASLDITIFSDEYLEIYDKTENDLTYFVAYNKILFIIGSKSIEIEKRKKR